jgi:hypothetical protein
MSLHALLWDLPPGTPQGLHPEDVRKQRQSLRLGQRRDSMFYITKACSPGEGTVQEVYPKWRRESIHCSLYSLLVLLKQIKKCYATAKTKQNKTNL